MARNTVPIIIGAVLFGVLALGLTFYTLLGGTAPAPPPEAQAGNASAAQAAPATTVYRARRAIYPRTIITRDMLEESDVDATKIPGSITDADAIVGRLANRTIQQGQIVTSDAITNGIGRVIPANMAIPAGLRGVAIWVNRDQTAAGLVDVGDRVDVIVAHDLVGGQTTSGATAVDFTAGRTIAQDLEVLAVDRSIAEYRPTPTTPEEGASAPAPGTPPAGAPPAQQPIQPDNQQGNIRVILAASPAIAQLLVTNDKQSELFLTIRNPNSRERFVLAENREYNKRAIAETAAEKPAASAPPSEPSDNTRSSRNRGSSEPPMMPPMFPTPAPTPVPPFIPNTGEKSTPTPAPDKDVTVIRGTEKTRVIVPR